MPQEDVLLWQCPFQGVVTDYHLLRKCRLSEGPAGSLRTRPEQLRHRFRCGPTGPPMLPSNPRDFLSNGGRPRFPIPYPPTMLRKAGRATRLALLPVPGSTFLPHSRRDPAGW